MSLSHPAWDAWIEISQDKSAKTILMSHPAWDAWIEIRTVEKFSVFRRSRIPHGMRGLKYLTPKSCRWSVLSHPAWDAWIEITNQLGKIASILVASRMGCVD